MPVQRLLLCGAMLLSACATVDLDAIAEPARGDVRGIFSTDDYPAAALRRGEEGLVRARLVVGPDGRVENCSIAESSGSERLDAATCGIMTRRARFTPARNGRGEAVSDTYTTPAIRWVIPGDGGPTPIGSPTGFRLVLDYDAGGRVTACRYASVDDAEAGVPCGPFYAFAHDIYSRTAKNIDLDDGVFLFERGTLREEEAEERLAQLRERGETIDEDAFAMTFDDKGKTTWCQEVRTAKRLYAEPDWMCDVIRKSDGNFPCDMVGNEVCAGAWMHYRILVRLETGSEELFTEEMRRPRLTLVTTSAASED